MQRRTTQEAEEDQFLYEEAKDDYGFAKMNLDDGNSYGKPNYMMSAQGQ